jgi:hypothetical protein
MPTSGSRTSAAARAAFSGFTACRSARAGFGGAGTLAAGARLASARAPARGLFCRSAGALAAGFTRGAAAGFGRCAALTGGASGHTLAADDLVEITLLPARGGFLIDQSESLAIELVEEFLPRDLLQRPGAAISRKIDPQDSRIIASTASTFYDRGASTTGFGPSADLVVVGGNFRFAFTCHESPSSMDLFFSAESFAGVLTGL